MILRAASYDDPDAVVLTERVQEYYVQVYGGRDDDPLTPEQLAPPDGGFLIGYLDARPVAMGGWFRSAGHSSTAHIRRMFVDSSVRRRGVARALLLGLEADAAAHGVTQMILTTGSPQTDAIALYRASGYVDVEPFGFYADSGTAVHLGKRLEPPTH